MVNSLTESVHIKIHGVVIPTEKRKRKMDLITKFIWNGKRPKISLEQLQIRVVSQVRIQDLVKGGLVSEAESCQCNQVESYE